MAIVNVALDDVGSGSGYVAYAGYVGFSQDWLQFSEDWATVLRQKLLPSLHTKDYLRANPHVDGTDAEQHQWETDLAFQMLMKTIVEWSHGLDPPTA